MKISFTVFRSDNLLSKTYSIDENNNITKRPAAQMTNGIAEQKTISFADFCASFDENDEKTAYGYGVFDRNLGDSVKIVTAKRVQSTPNAIARTREFFAFEKSPGVLMLDHDPGKNGRNLESPAALMDILADIDPIFSRSAYFARGSVSSGVERTGEHNGAKSAPRGFHIYIPVLEASQIPRIGEFLYKKLWLAGFGHIEIATSGAILQRTLIDACVFTPERLDFVGKPIIDGAGLTWRPPEAVFRDGEFLTPHLLTDLSANDEKIFQNLIDAAKSEARSESNRVSEKWQRIHIERLIDNGVSAVQAEKQIRDLAKRTGELPDDFELHFANLGVATVRDVRADPERYNDQALADPIEGPDYGRTTAKFWHNAPHGRPLIHSMAHGGCRYFFASDAKSKPEIKIEGGNKPIVVDACERILKNAGGIYQSGGVLVAVLPTQKNAISQIIPVDAPFLADFLMNNARFTKYSSTRQSWCETNLPIDFAVTLLARRHWPIPHLAGIIYAPTLRPDGSVINHPGYDIQTGLYADFNADDFVPIPDNPSRYDAIEAIEILKKPLSGFPFVAESDLSTAIAAILTALTRHTVDNSPLFLCTSPKMGSGKGLLVNAIAQIATGRGIRSMTQSTNADEDRKRLMALLISGTPLICMDNIENYFQSETLCTVLTMPELTDRLLGKTQMVSAPTRATFFATGNNVTVVGDLTRRVLPIVIDAGIERPHERIFDVHLPSYIEKNRASLVVAALTVLRAYDIAGRPRQNLMPFGSFESWSDWIRSAIVWAGLDDPCAGLCRWDTIDPIRSELAGVLECWHAAIGSESVTVNDLVKYATNSCEALSQALFDVADSSSGINRPRLGKFLMRHIDRIESGYRLTIAGSSGTRKKYRVEKII